MTKETEKTTILRQELDKMAEKFFPNLSDPELVRLALNFELSQK